MTADWVVDDEGRMELPVLTGFSVAVLPHAMLAVQLRYGPGDTTGVGNLQLGLNVETARELAMGLLKAADILGDTPGVGRLH
jgi:hypothetical protein